ncbi:hypothetical protein SAMN02799630_04132 [Paenibacillus sp. UNCCL117]|uniref:hypothetical protein n=1 Tax=unclassified Paenibacillus TaxID=185978 RepID=UPI0008925D8B|nr:MULTISPECIES: hypothetical protein [unclassified Paenibacillus]SDD86005.1 hypothetical protein SAMN04488602_114120 [Paenibacillus sp. cl123]SFW54258.1 hypothetical protein SAMN02799630_04132 [Paenibacillus sp. UNCCL117]
MRGLRWLIKLLVTAFVTAGCCVAFTFMTVNTYVDMILEQLHIERPATAQVEWGAFLSRFAGGFGSLAGTAAAGSSGADGVADATGAGASGKASSGPEKENAVAASGGQPSTETGSGSSTGKGDAGSKTPLGQPDPYRVPEDAVAVWSRQSTQSGSSGSGAAGVTEEERRVVVSSEEFTKKKDQLSDQAKAKIFSMLVTRMPPEEMQSISLLMEDGLTAAEMKEVETILQKHLKPEEFQDLLAIIGTP